MRTEMDLEREINRLTAMYRNTSSSFGGRMDCICDDLATLQAELRDIREQKQGRKPMSPLFADPKPITQIAQPKPILTPIDTMKEQIERLMAENAVLKAKQNQIHKYELEKMVIGESRNIPYNEVEVKRIRAAINNAKKSYLKGAEFYTRQIGELFYYGRVV